MKNKSLILAASLLAIMAAQAQAACDETLVKDLIGKKLDTATEKDAKARSGADSVKRAVTGEVSVTKNFVYDQLKIYVNKEGIIEDIKCGTPSPVKSS
jgi:hypothetical protein